MTHSQHAPIARGVLAGALALCLAVTPAAARAQHHHGDAPAAKRAPADAVPDATRRQILAVEQSLKSLATADHAREAGFEPVFGWIPSMGTHWVSLERMDDGFRLMEPDHLMFSPINGELKLVGAAYATVDAQRARMPDAFAGPLDRWHDHAFLAPPGQTVHMLHVWFVDSPDGPFAGHNPWLPFWALDLTPPDAARMRDPVSARRIRALAAALASTVEPGTTDMILKRVAGEGALEKVELRRARIRELLPLLKEAERRGDTKAWDRLAERGASEWRAIRAIYLASARSPRERAIIADVLDQVMGREDGAHH